MLKFEVFDNGKPVQELDLRNSYLIGADETPIRGQIQFVDGVIHCQKTSEQAAALALMWQLPKCGKFMLETTRLPDRLEPYNLSVELARCRLMRVAQKQEDWGLFSYADVEKINSKLQDSRNHFIQALQNLDQPPQAASLADKSLQLSMQAGDQLALFHAQLFLARRKQTASFARRLLGCKVELQIDPAKLPADTLSSFDFVTLPVSWAQLQPGPDRFNWKAIDRWIQFLIQRRMPIRIASLVRLDEKNLPPWILSSGNDLQTIRDLIYQYIAQVAQRYGKYIRSWHVVSSVHAENCFNFNFEQLLELTRLASMRAKQVCPRATTIVEITIPWGEYHARNMRTIHPIMYADMVAQSGINFDAFGLEMMFGSDTEGMASRDMLQISTLIDKFALMGKPVHISTAVPSEHDLPSISSRQADPGYWNEPWSQQIQARWLETFYTIALSKPQVESVTWAMLWDQPGPVHSAGLLSDKMIGKPAMGRLKVLRRQLRNTNSKQSPPAREPSQS